MDRSYPGRERDAVGEGRTAPSDAVSRWREVGDVAIAALALLRAWIDVRRTPPGELLAPARRAAEPAPPGRWPEVERCARAVRRTARYGPFRPTCLVRCIGLQRMLRRRGLPAGEIRIATRLEDGELRAHAWLRLGDRAPGEPRATIEGFDPLIDVRVADA